MNVFLTCLSYLGITLSWSLSQACDQDNDVIPGMEGSSPPLAVTYVVIEIVIVLGWAARAQPNREQSLFLVFHDKDVG